MGDTQASFSESAINEIRATYKSRCVICMSHEKVAQCAPIIDSKTQVMNAVRLGILKEGYGRDAPSNGMLLCPTCHSRFTQNLVVLSLPIPVLKYLKAHVQATTETERLPLHEVLGLLVDAKNGTEVSLSNPESVFPYLGLYTMVTLRPDEVSDTEITTSYFASLSVLRGNRFIKAPASTSATSAKAARIFDSSAIDNATPKCLGTVPLSPQDPGFKEQRYWRIPVAADAILAAFIERLHLDESQCEDVKLARVIRASIEMEELAGGNATGARRGGPRGSRRGGGGARGGRGGRGGRDGGGGRGGRDKNTGNKRKDPDDNRGASQGKKPRKATGRNLEHANGCIASQSSLHPNQSIGLMGVHVSDSGSESGLSVTAVHPHNKDDPKLWQFSPSFSTNKNVFIKRAISLVHP